MAGVYDLGSLLVHVRADATQYQATMGAVQKSMVAMQATATAVGIAMTTAFTLPLAIIGGASVKAFAGFNQEMTKSLAIMGDVDESTKQRMEDTARDLAQTTHTSAKQMAESYFFLASAGLDAEQSIAALPAVEKFAVAGAFDMATATDLATDAQSALGMVMQDSEENMRSMIKVTDILVGANTLANASTEQFSLALTSGAGTAMKNYGIAVEEGVAVLAAYADQGIKAQNAGNLFSRMIRLTTKGFMENGQAWKEFGLNIYDATGSLKPMATIVGDLSAVLGTMSTKQKIAALDTLGFQARSAKAILPLLGLGDAIAEYTKELENMAGITEEVADKQLKSFSNQIKITKNQFVEMGIHIGEILAPRILWLNEKIKEWIELWKRLSAPTKKLIVDIGLIVAAIGPLALLFGLALKAVLVFTAFLGTTFGAVLAGAIIGILGVISAVQDLRAVMDETGETEGSFLTKYLTQFESVQVGAAYLASALLGAWEMIKYGWVQTWTGMKVVWAKFENFILKGVGRITEKIGDMLVEMEKSMNALPGMLKPEGGFNFGGKAMQSMGIDLQVYGQDKIADALEEGQKNLRKYESAMNTIGEALGARLIDINKQFANTPKAVEEAGKAFKDYSTDYEELLAELERQNENFLESNYDNIGKKINDYATEVTNVIGNVTDVAIASWDELGNGLADMLLEGTYNWQEFGEQVLKELTRIFIKAMMVQAAMSVFGSFGGGWVPGGGTASVATAGAAGAGAAGSAGTATSMATQLKFHTGGVVGQQPLKSDERVIVAEDGEVMISKEDVSKAASESGGGAAAVHNTVELSINAIDGQNAYQFLSKNKRLLASLFQNAAQNNHPARRS